MNPYYQDSAVTIYHGDCREIVPTLDGWDAMITDLPYLSANVNLDRFANCTLGKAGGIDYAPASEDTLNWVAEQARRSRAFSVVFNCFEGVVFLRNAMRNAGLVVAKAVGVWAKGPALVMPCGRNTTASVDCDFMAIGKHKAFLLPKERPSFFTTPRAVPKDMFRVGGKPLPLMCEMVEAFTSRGDVILDCFSGGGTTGRAAKDLGRKAVLIEREERYCEIAARRMAQECLDLQVPA